MKAAALFLVLCVAVACVQATRAEEDAVSGSEFSESEGIAVDKLINIFAAAAEEPEDSESGPPGGQGKGKEQGEKGKGREQGERGKARGQQMKEKGLAKMKEMREKGQAKMKDLKEKLQSKGQGKVMSKMGGGRPESA